MSDFVPQALGGHSTALDDGVEAGLLGMANAAVEGVEGRAVVEIGHGDSMPAVRSWSANSRTPAVRRCA